MLSNICRDYFSFADIADVFSIISAIIIILFVLSYCCNRRQSFEFHKGG